VLSVSDRAREYAQAVCKRLQDDGLRAELDDRDESISRKIRDAELRKIPYMLVLGAREVEGGTVSAREHRAGDIGQLTLEQFIVRVQSTGASPPGA
jgi:threonyl-tRNA synthetase